MKKSIFIIIAILFAFNLSAQIYYNNNTVGNNSSALGANNTSNGTNSFVSGYNSQATGVYSSALGHTARATGMHSSALGSFSTAEGPGSVAIGPYALVNSNASMGVAIGNLVESHMPFGFIIGSAPSSSYKFINNISNSLMIGFNSNRPTLFISGSGGQEHTGKIGIGNVTSPVTKLHLKADNDEKAEVFLEWSNLNESGLYLGTTSYGLTATVNKLEFITSKGGKYIFNSTNAKVGIGTHTPTEKLEVAGNIKASGTGYMMTSKVQAIDNNGLNLVSTGGTGIMVANDGKVGIGTISALTEKLEVNGNIKQAAGYKMKTQEIRAIDANGLKLYNLNGSGIMINNSGKVGIGTSNPTAQLELYDIYAAGGTNLKIGNDSYLSDIDETNTLGILGAVNNAVGAIKLGLTGPKLYGENGNLGIGTTETTGYKLAVAGKIHAEEVMVEHADSWYDFVFDDDYAMPDIYDLEKFVKQNKHLPDIPGEQEVIEGGINLGEMNGLLLKKVEELTLYIIQQQKEIDELKRKLD